MFFSISEGFTTHYQPNGIELSVSGFINMLSSEYLIPILLAPLTLFLMLSKTRKFHKVKRRILKAQYPEHLEEIEPDIDSFLRKRQISVMQALLLRSVLEHQQDMMRGLTADSYYISDLDDEEDLMEDDSDSAES